MNPGYKIIVIGASGSGKTTLIRHLRTHTSLKISEMDEELTNLNGGVYPSDFDLKNTVLAPQVINDILNKDEMIFFTNTNYFTNDQLKKARQKNFKIVQLGADLGLLKSRNSNRVSNEDYDDLGQYLPGMYQYQQEIKLAGLVDQVINSDQSAETMAKQLIFGP